MYGIEKGNNQYGYEKNSHPKITQEQLASQMDMDVRTLQNYKMLADMIPELEDLVDTGILGDDATIIDVMQWMISHQDARRNLSPGELIYANSMVAEEIALENKEKVSKAVIESNKNRPNSNCVQMDACEKSTRDRSTNTREQVAKMSGVGTGTVARYTSGNLYMNLY